jgi:hypothetical protein
MATYPVLPTKLGVSPRPIKSTKIDRSEDGTARARVFYSSTRHTIPVNHPVLDSAQKSTLDAFYAANSTAQFDYVSPNDGLTYVCLFASAPRYTRRKGDRWEADVDLEQA